MTASGIDLSIVIVNWNTRHLLGECLDSVYRHADGIRFEIWLVDNASSDGSVAAVRQRFPDVRIVENSENLGFAAANNKAFRKMNGRYALLLNTDARLKADALSALVKHMDRHPDAAMACGQLLNEDGTRQNSVASFPGWISVLANESLLQWVFPGRFPGKRHSVAEPVAVDSCIGACLMVRKAAMDQVGLLDERYFFFMEETDWARQMKKAGWSVWFVPSAEIVHLQGRSVGHAIGSRILFYRARYQYFRKWYPAGWPVLFFAAFVRLWFNACLNLVAVVFTGGMHGRSRDKLLRYAGLIAWHLKGCPVRPVPGSRSDGPDG